MERRKHPAKTGDTGLLLEAQPGKEGLCVRGSTDSELCLAGLECFQHQPGARTGMRSRTHPVDGVHCRNGRRPIARNTVSRDDELAVTDAQVCDDPARRAPNQAANRAFRRTASIVKVIGPVKILPGEDILREKRRGCRNAETADEKLAQLWKI